MKNYKLLIIILIGLLFNLKLQAQQEDIKVTVEESEENIDAEKFKKLKSTYNYVVRAQVEELTLIKFDLIGPTLYAMNNSAEVTLPQKILGFSFERKLKPEWSWIIASQLRANNEELKEFNGSAGIRYYYNMNRRIAKGKSANNFSANYVSARADIKQRTNVQDDAYSIQLLYGMQRRLGKFGYVDFEIGYDIVIDSFKDSSAGVDFISAIELGIAF